MGGRWPECRNLSRFVGSFLHIFKQLEFRTILGWQGLVLKKQLFSWLPLSWLPAASSLSWLCQLLVFGASTTAAGTTSGTTAGGNKRFLFSPATCRHNCYPGHFILWRQPGYLDIPDDFFLRWPGLSCFHPPSRCHCLSWTLFFGWGGLEELGELKSCTQKNLASFSDWNPLYLF